MLLARKGYRVLLLDRATFPSDTISTHVVHLPAVAQLHSWGLLDKLRSSTCPPYTEISFDIGSAKISGFTDPINGIAEEYAPRRIVLDQILIDAAVAAGVELRDGFTVKDILVEDGKVVGITGHDKSKKTITEKATIVIGADGQRSMLARKVNAPKYKEQSPLTCCYYSYWSGLNTKHLEIFFRDGVAASNFPTNDGLTCVFVALKAHRYEEYRSNIEKTYLDSISLIPDFADRISSAKREDSFYGAIEIPNFFRKPYGEGWALVGDAGYYKDPTTALGITDAFRDAEILADFLDLAFSGKLPFDEALAGYESKRNSFAFPLYEYTCQISTLDLSPAIIHLITALQYNSYQCKRFLGVISATVSFVDFFSPENLGQIMSDFSVASTAKVAV